MSYDTYVLYFLDLEFKYSTYEKNFMKIFMSHQEIITINKSYSYNYKPLRDG